MPYKHYIAYSMYIGGSLNLIGYETQHDRDGAYDQYTKYGIIVEGDPHNAKRINPFMVCTLDVNHCALYQVH